jgi:hypothetical protein
MMIVTAAVAVAMVAFILYALERKSKGEPISWEHAGKLTLFSGLITSGVVFATTAEGVSSVTDVAATVAEKVADVQDMFVGTPSF